MECDVQWLPFQTDVKIVDFVDDITPLVYGESVEEGLVQV